MVERGGVAVRNRQGEGRERNRTATTGGRLGAAAGRSRGAAAGRGRDAATRRVTASARRGAAAALGPAASTGLGRLGCVGFAVIAAAGSKQERGEQSRGTSEHALSMVFAPEWPRNRRESNSDGARR